MSGLFNALVPARVAYGLLILGGIFGFIVGYGGSPWCLAFLPLSAMGFVAANRRNELAAHKHIWDVWHHCELSLGKSLVKGQLRDCLSCGEREVREVSV